ncbi:MAG: hypothetical protein V3T99_03990 [Nitrososphaerales archaeon]
MSTIRLDTAKLWLIGIILGLLLLPGAFLGSVIAQGGSSFEEAESITSGKIEGVFSTGSHYFKIEMFAGQSITILLDVPTGSDFNLFLYDPETTVTEQNLLASSELAGDAVNERIDYTANESGFYFVKLSGVKFSGGGEYEMKVFVTEFEVLFVGWGSQTSQVEVAPGDLGSPLNIVLRNGADFDMTDISVYLALTSFLSNSTGGRSLSGLSSTMPSGGSLSFSFLVNINDDTPLERQVLTLRIEYVMLEGMLEGVPVERDIQVHISGRSFIRMTSDTQLLSPDVANDVRLTIKNEGTANTGPIDFVLSIPQPLSLLGTDNSWSLRSLSRGEEVTLSISIFAPSTTRGQTFPIIGTTSFRNTFGVIRTETRSLSLRVEEVGRGGPSIVNTFWGSLGGEIPAAPGDQRLMLSVTVQNLDVGPISGIGGLLQLSTPFSNITGGNSIASFFGTTLQVGGIATTSFLLNIESDAEIGGYTLGMRVTYLDKDSILKRTELTFPVTVEGRSRIEVSSINNVLEAGTGNDINIEIANTGTAAIYSVTVRLSFPGVPSGVPISISRGDEERRIDSIQPGSATILSFPSYVSTTALEGLYPATISIMYRDSNGIGTTETKTFGFVVRDWVSPLSIEVDDNTLIAGQVTTAKLILKNEGYEPLSAIVLDIVFITLQGSSPLSLSSGSTSWMFDDLGSGANVVVEPSIFATLGAADSSFPISVKLSYLDSKGFPHTEVKEIGLSVRGRIILVSQDLRVVPERVSAGRNVTLVGSILNRGNAEALFMEASILTSNTISLASGSSQYIGEIDPNSPVPFSLAFQVGRSAPMGALPVVIQFAYEDAYGNVFLKTEEFVVEVGSFIPINTQDESPNGGLSFPFQLTMLPLGPIFIVAVIAIIVSILVLRRRGRNKDTPF